MSHNLGVQSCTGVELAHLPYLGPFYSSKTEMGYWGPQGPWRRVPLGYHYDPWDPLSVPQYNSLGYPKTRVVEVKNLIFRGNFGTLWVGPPSWNFFSFWLKGRVCLGLQNKKKDQHWLLFEYWRNRHPKWANLASFRSINKNFRNSYFFGLVSLGNPTL